MDKHLSFDKSRILPKEELLTFSPFKNPTESNSISPPKERKNTMTTKPNYKQMNDSNILQQLVNGSLKNQDLENLLGDHERAVRIRREWVAQRTKIPLTGLSFQNYDYAAVAGQCCENVIGTVQIPVGAAGPLIVDGTETFLPIATTEGALVASITRGCKVLSQAGGVRTQILDDGMTRAPVLHAPNAEVANQIKQYVTNNVAELARVIESTSRFTRLLEAKCFVAGRKVFIRFKCTTGDAMGMNMVGKAVEKALDVILAKFPVQILSLSGNMCTDKKPSAINWIEGRGKSVVAECVIPASIVENNLKTNVDALIEVNYAKNLVGSAMAGSIGGFNCHAANVVAAMFLATGQDIAQTVESSNCMTLVEKEPNGDLYVSVTLPCLEVGTVGGGTHLAGQASMLGLLGVTGSDPNRPGFNAQRLARIISAAVLAGELSLLSALSAGHLISSHLKLNRKSQPSAATAPTTARSSTAVSAARTQHSSVPVPSASRVSSFPTSLSQIYSPL